MNIVYLNGNYSPIEQASISVLDRGFLFADGVYEVITVYNGKLFHAEDHIDRLNKSLNAIHLTLKMTNQQWMNIFDELLKRNKINSQNISLYLQITRGAESTRSLGLPEKSLTPTIFVMLKELITPDYHDLTKGFGVITRDDIRWKKCFIKSIALLPNILMQYEARQANANEVIFIRNEKIMEGSSSNIYVIKDNIINTPALSDFVLEGITRKLILALAHTHHIKVQERELLKSELFTADEVWISSTSRDVMPITKIDNKIIHDGKPGPLWKIMLHYLQKYRQSL